MTADDPDDMTDDETPEELYFWMTVPLELFVGKCKCEALCECEHP